MSAYYNEFDPFAAAWLRELVTAGQIAPGDVDERSITEVSPDDLRPYTQCHFFAGIGGWSLALRLAGWPDDRPVWTGSCPCQPFSAAGKQEGGADDRHLWPHWARLIRECRPVAVFGEQVESAIAHGWLDAVFDDLEREGYACGAACLPAASVGAPHIRQRVWFVAESEHAERRPLSVDREDERHGPNTGREKAHGQPGACSEIRGMADAERGATERRRHDVGSTARTPEGAAQERQWLRDDPRDGESTGRMADDDRAGRGEQQRSGLLDGERPTLGHDADGCGAAGAMGHASGAGLQGAERRGARHDERDGPQASRPTGESGGSPWSDLFWLPCRDGKTRPTEPGLFPLAHGVSARVGRLRGYGNAIVPQVAAEVIRAYLEIAS